MKHARTHAALALLTTALLAGGATAARAQVDPCGPDRCAGSLKGLAKALHGSSDARSVLARLAPALDDGSLPAGPVRVLEVRDGAALRMAFVEVRPAGYSPCASDPGAQARVRALHVARDASGVEAMRLDGAFGADAVRFFQGTRVAVSFPTAVVPVFEVQYTHQVLCPGVSEGQDGRMVEAFHLGRAERLGAPRRVDTGREIAGRSSRTKATWRWAPRREGAADGEGPDGTGAARAAGAFWVWQVLATEVVYPCTASAPEGTDCHPVTSCTMRPEILEVDADGLRPSTLDPATLARLQPKLAPVLREAEASSLGACKRLAKP